MQSVIITGVVSFIVGVGCGVFSTIKWQSKAMAELQSLRNSAAAAIKGKG